MPAETLKKSDPLPEIPLAPDVSDDDASDIDLASLTQIDLALTKMYRALAFRHDKLVDEVMKQLQKQAQAK